MTVTFDKSDYHVDAALQAGQPEEHAFTHIGLYLMWMVRHDLQSPDFILDEWVAALRSGEMIGSDLADAIDGKLTSDLFSAEGAAFTAARYDRYLDDYAEIFAAEGYYAVADTAQSYARIGPAIDRLHEQWIADDRPSPEVTTRGSVSGGDPPGSESKQPAAFTDSEGWEITEVTATAPQDIPHRAPDLEQMIPRDASRPLIETSSVHAGEWGDALLKRALKRLGVEPKEALVANGIGGEGEGTFTVTLYAVPDVGSAALHGEFASVFYRPPRTEWELREVNGKDVNWLASEWFHAAFWSMDGLVVHASAQDADRLERLVAQLP
ncbi:MAG TPA: hypothetical protein VI277_06145 [Candidatus Limnocylindria bacterium]